MTQVSTPPRTWDEWWRVSLWRFDLYRRFAHEQPPSIQNMAENRAAWANMPVPPGHPLRRRGERVGAMRVRYLERGHMDPSIDVPNVPPGSHRWFVEAFERRDEMRDFFSEFRDLQYIRALGYGGNGLAIQYRYQDGQNPFDFVVKIAIDDWEHYSIRHEEKYTKKMARAAHSIQLIPRSRIGLPDARRFAFEDEEVDDSSEDGVSSGDESRADEPNQDALDMRTRRKIREESPLEARLKDRGHRFRLRASRETKERRRAEVARIRGRRAAGLPFTLADEVWDADRKDFMLLEFCPNGDLEKLLLKVRDRGEWIPNRVLWSFWLCLVRACLGMQYPPRKFHPRRKENPPADRSGIPGVSNDALGKMVGQDLFEEVPVFISGVDVGTQDAEHRLIPRLKLADFGLAKEIKPKKRNSYYYYQRDRAKFGYYAPEQFGQDWNYIVQPDGEPIEEDGPEISEQRIAGNYGPATNVWGIALLMWQLMTQMWAPVPPQLQARTGLHANLPYNFCPLLLTDDRYDVYDVELRETIARCMAYDPQDRPTLPQLLQAAKRGIEKRFDRETDLLISDWVQEVLFNA
ncbi:kinase-like domain-containing protein [Xylaria venustula]|nr:kinase-like domain-containing protein [Xylaria venustula]